MPTSSRPVVAPPSPRSRGKRALAVWAWILGVCLAALIATYVMFVEPPPPRRLVIASGGQKGSYYRYAQEYAEELRKVGLSVEVRETAGSVENLQLLGQDGSGVAPQGTVIMPWPPGAAWAVGPDASAAPTAAVGSAG